MGWEGCREEVVLLMWEVGVVGLMAAMVVPQAVQVMLGCLGEMEAVHCLSPAAAVSSHAAAACLHDHG